MLLRLERKSRSRNACGGFIMVMKNLHRTALGVSALRSRTEGTNRMRRMERMLGQRQNGNS
jgi:hypothetical protein